MAEHFNVAVVGGEAAGDDLALVVKAGAALPAAAHGQGVTYELTIGASPLRQGVTV